MKKYNVLLIGIVVLSLLFTACGSLQVTPTDTTPKTGQTVKENNVKETDETSKQTTANSNEDDNVDDNATATVPPTDDAQTSSVTNSESNAKTINDDEDFDAIIGEAQPTFTTESGFSKWLIADNTDDVYPQQKDTMLSTMNTNDYVVYYRPDISEDNPLLELKEMKIYGTTIVYYYRFKQEEYSHLNFRIACYTDPSLKDIFTDNKNKAGQSVSGYSLTTVAENEIAYHVNERMNLTTFAWQQYSGYHSATLRGDNHADIISNILPLLNLEQVTLRTDTVTQ